MVQQAAADEQARLAGAAAALRREVGELLRDGMTVMTLSLSSTIMGAVREAAGKPRVGLGAALLQESGQLAGGCHQRMHNVWVDCSTADSSPS